MKNGKSFFWVFGILGIFLAGSVEAADGTGVPIRPTPTVPRTGPVSMSHEIEKIIRVSGIGKVELDLTAHQIIFTDLKESGGMHIRLFRNEEHERLPFSIVHSVRKVPFVSGVTYKLMIMDKERFWIVYFREYEGRITIKRPFD